MNKQAILTGSLLLLIGGFVALTVFVGFSLSARIYAVEQSNATVVKFINDSIAAQQAQQANQATGKSQTSQAPIK